MSSFDKFPEELNSEAKPEEINFQMEHLVNSFFSVTPMYSDIAVMLRLKLKKEISQKDEEQ